MDKLVSEAKTAFAQGKEILLIADLLEGCDNDPRRRMFIASRISGNSFVGKSVSGNNDVSFPFIRCRRANLSEASLLDQPVLVH